MSPFSPFLVPQSGLRNSQGGRCEGQAPACVYTAPEPSANKGSVSSSLTTESKCPAEFQVSVIAKHLKEKVILPETSFSLYPIKALGCRHTLDNSTAITLSSFIHLFMYACMHSFIRQTVPRPRCVESYAGYLGYRDEICCRPRLPEVQLARGKVTFTLGTAAVLEA